MEARNVKTMQLHVQEGNDAALSFYKRNGFIVKEKIENYYTEYTPSGCYLLEKYL
jgi:ribosomal protein S18 acetylase RimI-like enzyme